MSDETTDEPTRIDSFDGADAIETVGTDRGADRRAGAPKDVEGESRAQAARRIAWAPRTRIAVVSLALVAMMFLFVFPTRSYLAQKRQVGQAAHAVDVLESQNAVLARQASRLKTRTEIERLAREQFNMVMPGEQAYDVVEAPGSNSDTTTTTTP
jgi:cell division protein FtsB